jgi:hypothetical protein
MHMASADSREPARSERPTLERARTPSPTAQSNLPSSDPGAPADDSSKASDLESSPTDSGYRSGGSDTAADLKRQRTSYDRKAILEYLDKLYKGAPTASTTPGTGYLDCWYREFHVPVTAWPELRDTIWDPETGPWSFGRPACPPRINYNAYTEILTLRMPKRLHETVMSKIEQAILDKLRTLSNDANLPAHVRALILDIEPTKSTEQPLDQSRREPDLSFAHPELDDVTFVGEMAWAQRTT